MIISARVTFHFGQYIYMKLRFQLCVEEQELTRGKKLATPCYVEKKHFQISYFIAALCKYEDSVIGTRS